MQYFNSFAALIKNYKTLHYPGRIYVQGDQWDNLPDAQYWVISSGEAKELELVSTDYGDLPESLATYQVRYLLDTGSFQIIIGEKYDRHPEKGLEDLAGFNEAIVYYLENDDFIQ